MYRTITTKLQEWKSNPNRKPLIIQGARQVGKTWIMKDFGSRCFSRSVYINFESSSRLKNMFLADYSIPRLIKVFEIESGVPVNEDTLIILDEIQEAEGGLTALKYFQENAPHYYVIAAGSLLGVSLQKNHTFPVGKVDLLTLYPMTFEEFLYNQEERVFIQHLKQNNWGVINPFHEKLTDLLRLYYFTGGMPEALKTYFDSGDLKQVREIQKKIIFGYEHDFAKYAPMDIVARISMVWQSLIGQLSKENKKFMYSQVKKGGRAKEFDSAISWLVNAGLVYRCNRITKPAIPLASYIDPDAFKLYLLDIGLLNALGDVEESILLEKNRILQEYKGAMTEQYVCQQLKVTYSLYYWSAERGSAELDFIIQRKSDAIPIEVKAENNVKAKSIGVYIEKFKPRSCIRLSMSEHREHHQLILDLPLYATFTL